jgi:hypothetical protein
MGRRVPARVGPLISYCPLGLGKLGKRVVETEAVCTRCGNTSWAPGAETKSRISALVMLKLSCPRREENFYVEAYPMPRVLALKRS